MGHKSWVWTLLSGTPHRSWRCPTQQGPDLRGIPFSSVEVCLVSGLGLDHCVFGGGPRTFCIPTSRAPHPPLMHRTPSPSLCNLHQSSSASNAANGHVPCSRTPAPYTCTHCTLHPRQWHPAPTGCTLQPHPLHPTPAPMRFAFKISQPQTLKPWWSLGGCGNFHFYLTWTFGRVDLFLSYTIRYFLAASFHRVRHRERKSIAC